MFHTRKMESLNSVHQEESFVFQGRLAALCLSFFDYAADGLHRAASTAYSYQLTLDMLNRYLERRSLSVNDISADVIECFLKESSSTIRARHTHANSLRQFFRYLYYRHYSRMDLSLYVLPDICNRHSIVSTTGYYLLTIYIFTIFYKLALGVTGFAAGSIYLILGVCIVIALLQGYWVNVGIVFAAACVVFLITMTAELVLMGLEALSGLLSGFIFSR